MKKCLQQSGIFWRRYKNIGFFILSVGIIAVSISYFFTNIDKPTMGIILGNKDGYWQVESVEANGLVEQVGIREGDIPLEINGQPADVFLEKYSENGILFGFKIDSITVTNNSGEMMFVSKDTPPASYVYVVQILSWFVICLIWWVTGLFAFYKKPDNLAAFLYCLCGLAFGLALSANSTAVRDGNSAIFVEVFGTVVSPWLLLHFFIVLPEEQKYLVRNRYIYLIYLPVIIILILYPLIGYSNGQSLPEFRTFRIFGYGFGLASAVGVAIFNFFYFKSAKTHMQMKIVLTGCTIALIPFLIMSIIPAAFLNMPISEFSVTFFAIIPLSMGYAIIAEKLMEIDILIRRGAIYGIVTIAMAGLLSITIFLMWTFQDYFDLAEELVVAVVLSGIAMILFGPVRKSVEILLDKFLYKDRYDYRQIIHNVGVSLNSVSDSINIARLVVGTIVNTLNLSGGCLLAKRESSLQVRAAQGVLTKVTTQKKLLDLVAQGSPENNFPNMASEEFSGLAYIIPLATAGREVGFLCLAEKASRQDFSSDDLFLIDGIASLAAIKLHSAKLLHDVSVRDTFVSVASHELRTPLTSIVGYADLLMHRNPSEEIKKQWTKKIVDSGMRLSSMVDDLLNVSRIHSGKVQVSLEEVQLPDIIKESVSWVTEIIDIHQLVTIIQPDLPRVLADKEKLKQVIMNLLNNAVKYSPGGGEIVVSAYCEPGKNCLVISVRDEGIGISPDDIRSLFTSFHRIQRQETANIRGSGLGLYIAREWTEAMGGKIWVESELNKGSTFYIAIPKTTEGETMGKNNSNSAKRK